MKKHDDIANGIRKLGARVTARYCMTAGYATSRKKTLLVEQGKELDKWQERERVIVGDDE